jgi:hypothetical protein
VGEDAFDEAGRRAMGQMEEIEARFDAIIRKRFGPQHWKRYRDEPRTWWEVRTRPDTPVIGNWFFI